MHTDTGKVNLPLVKQAHLGSTTSKRPTSTRWLWLRIFSRKRLLYLHHPRYGTTTLASRTARRVFPWQRWQDAPRLPMPRSSLPRVPVIRDTFGNDTGPWAVTLATGLGRNIASAVRQTRTVWQGNSKREKEETGCLDSSVEKLKESFVEKWVCGKARGAVDSLSRNNDKLGHKLQQNISLIVAIKKDKLLRNDIAIKLIKLLLSYF